MKVRIRTKQTEGNAYVTFGYGTKIVDTEEAEIATDYYSGIIQIGGPQLLGDFNNDHTVNLSDFIAFARHYLTTAGDGKYRRLYDIAPAEKGYGGIWSEVYSKATVDGKVNVSDFIIFARNYFKTVDDNKPPMINKAGGKEGETEEGAITFRWTGKDNDGTIRSYEIRKDEEDWEGNATSTSYYWDEISLGAHRFEVRGKDNKNEYSNTLTWEFNRTLGNGPIHFEDPVLEAAVRNANGYTGQATGSIYPEDVLGITTLDVSGPADRLEDPGTYQRFEGTDLLLGRENIQGVSSRGDLASLEGIQYLTNLVELRFSYNQVTNLTPLSNLSNLRVLYFKFNEVSDLTPLQNLTNLQSLNFAGNQVTDLSPLQNLTKLTFLYFSATAVSDLAPLQNLTNLEDLYSCDNQVTNLTPLQNLTKLRVLALRSNAITDILPLVNNSGLGAGDYIGLQFNNLNLATGSQDEQYINTLLSRGCDVIAEPQNPRFLMGNTRGESGTNADPVHEVLFTYPFSIEPYEVTFSDYDTYCDATGKSKPGDEGWGRDQRPVINVTWWDAIKYCNWMSIQENYPVAYDEITGSLLDANGNPTTDITKVKGYRLPTEAEWEYATRGGNADITNGVEANDYIYAGSNDLDEVGWYRDNSEWKTQPVGQKKANERVFFDDIFWTEGLFDMSGNVTEWCHDWWGVYPSSMQTNPIGPGSGSNRVYRGGSSGGNSEVCRVAFRDFMTPTHSNEDVGFRLARTVY